MKVRWKVRLIPRQTQRLKVEEEAHCCQRGHFTLPPKRMCCAVLVTQLHLKRQRPGKERRNYSAKEGDKNWPEIRRIGLINEPKGPVMQDQSGTNCQTHSGPT